MSRREFTKAVSVAIIKRASQNDVPYCEECHQQATRFHIDHIDPDGLQTDKSKKLKPEEGRLLCLPCHAEKTKADVANIAKAKRREAKHLGVKSTAPPIQSRGFVKAEKPPKAASKLDGLGLSNLARRYGL